MSSGRFLQDEFVEYVNFLIEWFYELRDSNAYRLNAEMAYCIEKLVERWNLQRQQRIIVFTVGTDFAIRKIKRNVISKRIDYLLTLQLKTGITFTKEPVFIFVPDQFKDDILSCVLLFHEVGHFVDRDNYIADFVFHDIMPKIAANKTSKLRTDYFPRYLRADISKIPALSTAKK